MRSGSVEIVNVLLYYPVEMPLIEDDHVIQAFTSNTPQKTFTHGIGSGSANGRSQDVDPARCTGKFDTIFPIIVAD
jgi:hypothetical protein